MCQFRNVVGGLKDLNYVLQKFQSLDRCESLYVNAVRFSPLKADQKLILVGFLDEIVSIDPQCSHIPRAKLALGERLKSRVVVLVALVVLVVWYHDPLHVVNFPGIQIFHDQVAGFGLFSDHLEDHEFLVEVLGEDGVFENYRFDRFLTFLHL